VHHIGIIDRLTLTKDQQLMKLNLGTDAKPQLVNINAQLEIGKVLEVEQLLKEFKDVLAWTYKDLKRISLELAQHKYYYTINTLGQVYIKFKLCYNN
jgi:hypothetical protein